jgi:hypothetical protein
MHRIRFSLAVAVGAAATVAVWTRRAMRWGATGEEIASPSTAENWFEGVPGSRVRIVRAISIGAPPQTVWPWLAQNGRGAGWYSWEHLDNGGRASARHIVQWVPDPAVGDAAGIGYLRHLEHGRELVWWAPDDPFLGASTWSAWQYTVTPEGDGSRVVMRVDLAATGRLRWVPLLATPLVDAIMAQRQFRNLKDLVERYGARTADPDTPETGARDQYQLFHVIYASGAEAGVPGVENARQARKWAEGADALPDR